MIVVSVVLAGVALAAPAPQTSRSSPMPTAVLTRTTTSAFLDALQNVTPARKFQRFLLDPRAIPTDVLVDDASHELYVFSPNLKRIDVLNADTGEAKGSVQLPGGIDPLHVDPDRVAFLQRAGSQYFFVVMDTDSRSEIVALVDLAARRVVRSTRFDSSKTNLGVDAGVYLPAVDELVLVDLLAVHLLRGDFRQHLVRNYVALTKNAIVPLPGGSEVLLAGRDEPDRFRDEKTILYVLDVKRAQLALKRETSALSRGRFPDRFGAGGAPATLSADGKLIFHAPGIERATPDPEDPRHTRFFEGILALDPRTLGVVAAGEVGGSIGPGQLMEVPGQSELAIIGGEGAGALDLPTMQSKGFLVRGESFDRVGSMESLTLTPDGSAGVILARNHQEGLVLDLENRRGFVVEVAPWKLFQETQTFYRPRLAISTSLGSAFVPEAGGHAVVAIPLKQE